MKVHKEKRSNSSLCNNSQDSSETNQRPTSLAHTHTHRAVLRIRICTRRRRRNVQTANRAPGDLARSGHRIDNLLYLRDLIVRERLRACLDDALETAFERRDGSVGANGFERAEGGWIERCELLDDGAGGFAGGGD